MSRSHSKHRTGVLALEGDLDLYTAERTQATLSEWLRADHPAEIDLAAVGRCDAAGVQLLLAARTSAAARGHALRFAAVPDSVAACCRRLGLPALS